MTKVGIGIVTYNRLPHLKRVVAAVRACTQSDYELVVAEDGGSDGSREWCASEGIRLITGDNAGVCWNKNRALFALQSLGCDPIVLLEDDCIPIEPGWETDWKIGTALYGHLAFAHPKLTPWLISGTGTAIDPFVNNKATAQCSSVSGRALVDVGFFDTRFKGYGVGHAEWTTRLKRAGYGYKRAIDAEGRQVKANLYITGGLAADDGPTFKDKANVKRNEALFDAIKAEPVYRHPWTTEDERERFVAEMRASRIRPNLYGKISRDKASGGSSLAVGRLPAYASAIERMMDSRSGFMRRSGWLPSLALGLPVSEGELLPPYCYPAIEFLGERAKPEWRVFHYGWGYACAWWAARVAEVVAVDRDLEPSEMMRRLTTGARLQIRRPASGEAFAATIEGENGFFDVVSVGDVDRAASARTGIAKLSEDGVLILDDCDRADVAEVRLWLTGRGFRTLRLQGPAPLTHESRATAFFYRSRNVLGL